MPRNLALKRGLRGLAAGFIGCLLGNWHAIALRLPEPTPAEIVAQRFPDLAPSQIVALRFPDLAPSQIVALRFFDLPAVRVTARRFSDAAPAASAFAAKLTDAAAPAASAAPVRLINFQVTATLAPIGHSRFCLRYPDDCQVHAIDFRRRNIKLTPQRWNQLNMVNRAVNRRIFAEVTPGDGTSDDWVIGPPAGDCKDYAVTQAP